MSSSKVHSLDFLAQLVRNYRSIGSRIVLAHGAWRLLHIGHIEHLQAAAAMGNHLIVTVTSDEYLLKTHGPIFSEQQRARGVAALECVDYVTICDAPTAAIAIQAIQPHVFVKGSCVDLASNGFKEEADAVEAIGGKLRITETSALLHSSDIIGKVLAYG